MQESRSSLDPFVKLQSFDLVPNSQVADCGLDMIAAQNEVVGDSGKLIMDHLAKVVDWLETLDNFAMWNGSS